MSKLRFIFALAVLSLVALGACKGDAPAPAPGPAVATETAPGAPAAVATPAPAPDAAPAAPAPTPLEPQVAVKVTLLDPGTEPRVSLLIAPSVGQAERVEAAVRLEEHMFLGEQLLPNPAVNPVRFRLEATPQAADAAGVTPWTVALAGVDGIGLDGAPAPAQQLLGKVLDGLRGARLDARVSAAGQTVFAPFAAPAGEKLQIQRLVESYVQVLRNVATARPDAPVGPGARWQVEESVRVGLLTAQQTALYELVAVDGQRVKTRVTLTSSVASDAPAPAGMPPGTRVKSFVGSGSGEKTLALGRFLPVEAQMRLHVDVTLELPRPQDQKPGTLQVGMDLGLTVGDPAPIPEPAPAPEPKPAATGHEGHDHGAATPPPGAATPPGAVVP